MITTQRRAGVALACTLVLAMVGPAAAVPAGVPIRIGGSLALTGPLAATALVHKIAGDIFIEQVNRKGGLLGRPVEWVLLDDESRPDLTRTLYERLIADDKVDLLMGPYATGAILPAMSVAKRHDKVLVHDTFGIPHLARYDMQFPTWAIGPEPDRSLPQSLLDALATSGKPVKTIGIVTSTFPSVHFMSLGARQVAKQRGLHEVLYFEFEFGHRDFSAIAARVREADPDLLWMGAIGLEGNLLLDALRKLDYAPRTHFYLYPAPGPLALAREARHALSTTVFEEHPPFTSTPRAAEFVRLYHERAARGGLPYQTVELQAGIAYAAWQILEAAISGTKSLDDKTLAQWLRSHRVDTIIGTLRFDGPNNYGDDMSKIKQLQDGKWVVVWPKEFAAPGARLLVP
jgi:ABC-type branched-subunit amino acid transport system substrate-binding protein